MSFALFGRHSANSDIISDALLVALPIRLLRNVNLPKNQRTLILSVFSTSVLITFICIVHIVFVIEPAQSLQTITGQLEIALSLIVCNLLVIVTYFYGVFRNGEDIDVGHRNGSAGTRTIMFTTVDLDQLTSHPSASFISSDDPQVDKSVTSSAPTIES